MKELEVGKNYRFDYVSPFTGKSRFITAKLVRMDTDVLWFNSSGEEDGDIPFETRTLSDVEEIK